ncbi:MAG: hypothetical protein EOO20_28915 [Chryseobacterium sp.]|nr:MAG: hypothetical protein EOO20_28915 [Chryseobacterium sp.]
MQEIDKILEEYLLGSEQSIQEILFIATDAHPVWDDNLEILRLAVQQVLQPVGALADEYILAFIGVHAQTIISGKRDSIGFLITNHRILTQTDFSVIGKPEKAQIDLFTTTQSPGAISSKVWNDFTVKNRLSVDQEILSALHSGLESVLNIVLPGLQQSGNLPEAIKKSSSLRDRIAELGLEDALKSFSANEKKYKLFAEKYNVPDILYGMVDKPLFSGVYGLVISAKGITSRDLMEESQSSDWQEIKDNPARIADKKDQILIGNKKHIVPASQTDKVPSLIELINPRAASCFSLFIDLM